MMEPFESVRRLRSVFNLARTAGLLVALSVSLAGCTGTGPPLRPDTDGAVKETEGYTYWDGGKSTDTEGGDAKSIRVLYPRDRTVCIAPRASCPPGTRVAEGAVGWPATDTRNSRTDTANSGMHLPSLGRAVLYRMDQRPCVAMSPRPWREPAPLYAAGC